MFENIHKEINYSKKGILSKDIVKTAKLNICLFCMAQGTQMDEHTSVKQAYVYVIEGKGIFTLEGKAIPMLPGVFIPMSPNAVHSLQAEENTSFMLILQEK